MRVLLAVFCLIVPAITQAAEFCTRAQAIIADTALQPAVVLHSDWEAFVESKPSDVPFEIHQYFSSHLTGEDAPVTVVSCKMRTVERINNAHQQAGSDTPVAGLESTCDAIHRDMLDQAYRQVPKAEQVIAPEQWSVAEEKTEYIGPKWLEPWPFVPLNRLADGGLQLNTRALYAPHAWWIPMPERFLGNYYCHLIAPSYLHSLVRGEQLPPDS